MRMNTVLIAVLNQELRYFVTLLLNGVRETGPNLQLKTEL